jgi:hypothetical protein
MRDGDARQTGVEVVPRVDDWFDGCRFAAARVQAACSAGPIDPYPPSARPSVVLYPLS